MTSYLLRARHVVREVQASPQEITDWLERTLGTDGVEVVRTGDTALAFRSKSRLMASHHSSDSIAFLASGEIEVSAGQEGPVITVRANPQTWQWLVATAWFATVLGWGNLTGPLRWGAGLGGILLSGVVLFLTWGSINSFLSYKSGILRMLRARPELPAPDRGAA